jgi:glutathione S-transferase
MDLFDQKTVADEQYGSTGDMKKTQFILQLLGAPYCAETLKCILTAGEQGMEMNCGALEPAEMESKELEEVSAFGMLPALKENDYYTAGTRAITEFINARGLGFSLVPKNVNQAAETETWMDKATQDAGPHIDAFVGELTGNAGDVDAARAALGPILDELNDKIGNNKFIVGKNYSFADLYWTAHLHLLSLTSGADLINARSNIVKWMDGIKSKKSNCGQSLIAATLLPSAADIKANTLPNVAIDDF